MFKYLFIIYLLINTTANAQIPYINSGELLTKGVELYEKGDYKQSIEQYRQINECDTNYPSAVYELVLSLTADSSFELAKSTAISALYLPGSDKHKLLLSLAAAYDYLGKSDSALLIYDSLKRTGPNDYAPWYEEGIIFLRKEQYDKALNCFQHSLTINPEHFSSHYMTGLIYMYQGRLTEAFIALESSLLMTENTHFAKKAIALLSSITEEPDETAKMYLKKKEQYSHPLFDDIDQIVNSKIALSTDYKLKMSLGDNIFRQSQVIMEKLKYDPADTNFVMQYYVPLLVDIFKQDQFESYILLQYSGYDFENVNNLAKKKSKEIDDVKKNIFPYFGKIQATREVDFTKRQKAPEHYHYYPKDNLIIIGNSIPKGNDDLVVGDVDMYRYNQTLLNHGHYDADGEKDGLWTGYYTQGGLRSRQHFAHGKEIDSSSSYYQNGNRKGLVLFDKEGSAREEYIYSSKGWLSEKKKKLTDKIIEHISYYSNGQIEYVEKYDDKDYIDGTYKSYFADGTKKKEVSYKDGKLSGVCNTWFINGRLNEELHYEDGKLNGPDNEYYETGKIKEKSFYKNGKLDGLDQKFDNDGILTDKLSFSNGKLEEINKYTPSGFLYGTLKLSNERPYYIKYTNEDGAVLSEKEDKNGIFEYSHYFSNGNVAAELKINDKGDRNGLQTFYYGTGAKSEETNYKDGSLDGSSVTYYKNGHKKEEEYYVSNKRDGYYKQYYDNGAIKGEGWYKEGQKQGPWKYYYVNGKIEYEQYLLNDKFDGYYKEYNINGDIRDKYVYDNGEIISHTCYDTAGRKTDSVYFNPTAGSYKMAHRQGEPGGTDLDYSLKYGNMDGLLTIKFYSGDLLQKSYYKDGKRDSIFTMYFPDGKIRSKGRNKNDDKVGKWEYYNETGDLWREENLDSSGDLEGPSKTYLNGVLRNILNYKNGEKDSMQVYYGENDRIAFEMLYKDGNFIGYTYEGKDGNLLPVIKVKNGTANFVTYYSNGQKSAEGALEQNFFKGQFNIYYSNGTPAEQRFYNNNYNLEGDVRKYYPNGKLGFVMTYKDDEETGIEYTYDKDGNQVIAAGYYYGSLNGPTVITDPATHNTATYYYHFGQLTSVSK